MEPRVTVVVMTRDRYAALGRTLPRHPAPVVVVDNGSDDGTPSRVATEFPHVRVIRMDRNRGAVARNVGVEAALTPYVAFADDDSWWEPGALEKAAAVLDAHPRLAVLAARTLVGPDRRPDPVSQEMAHSPLTADADLPGPSVLGFLACAAVVRRDAFLAAGGFDEVVFFFGEEARLAIDLARDGWGLAYVDEVVARHDPDPGPRDRRALASRNRVLTAVMRRPWRVVLREARAADGRGVLQAVPRLPRALARRRVVPPDLEARLALLERLPAGAPGTP